MTQKLPDIEQLCVPGKNVTTEQLALILTQMQKHHEEFTKKLIAESRLTRDQLDTIEDELARRWFPEGDGAGHKSFHQVLVLQYADRKALWKSIRNNTLTMGSWLIVVLICNAIWGTIKRGVTP